MSLDHLSKGEIISFVEPALFIVFSLKTDYAHRILYPIALLTYDVFLDFLYLVYS